MRSAKKISCKFCGHNHQPDRKICPARGKKCKRCKKKCHFAKKCEKVLVHNIESDKELEEISIVRVQALRGRAVYARMLPKLVSVMDEDATHTKLRHRQHQLARYFNRGAGDLQSL